MGGTLMHMESKRALSDAQDAYGRLMLDWHQHRPAVEVVERDDGYLQANRVRSSTSNPSGAGRKSSVAPCAWFGGASSTSDAGRAG